MKKFNSFEEKLGAYMVEYAGYTLAGIAAGEAYMCVTDTDEEYPFFRYMCDAILRDVMHAQLYTDPTEYLLTSTHDLLRATLGGEVDNMHGTYAYTAIAHYAAEAQKFMRNKLNTYVR